MVEVAIVMVTCCAVLLLRVLSTIVHSKGTLLLLLQMVFGAQSVGRLLLL